VGGASHHCSSQDNKLSSSLQLEKKRKKGEKKKIFPNPAGHSKGREKETRPKALYNLTLVPLMTK